MKRNKEFKPLNLIDPIYLFKRIRTIRSTRDLFLRASDVLRLIKKLLTGQYGQKQWKLKHEKYLADLDKRRKGARTDPGGEKPAPYRVFWNWDIIKTCNYTCSYCFYSGSDDKGTLFLKPDVWQKAWENIFYKYGECHIHIAGGEPTTYPGFFKILNLLSSLHTLEVSTNLSFDLKHLTKVVSNERVRLGASFHPTQADFYVFKKKVGKLADKGYDISVSYVAHPLQFEKMPFYKKEIEEAGIPFNIQPFRGRHGGGVYPGGYSKTEIELLDSLSSKKPAKNRRGKFKCKTCSWDEGDPSRRMFVKHVLNSTNKTARKRCLMGYAYGKIFSDGSVYRCCSPGTRKLGSIIDPDFRLMKSPLSCDAERCVCYKPMVEGCKR